MNLYLGRSYVGIFLHFFLGSSRLLSLVCAAKISHLLHFVAKTSHCRSSIFPLVSGFFSTVFIEFSMFFIDSSMIFIDFSMVVFNFPWLHAPWKHVECRLRHNDAQ